MERGETEDWFATPYIVALSVIAFFGLLIFLWWELKTAFPVVNLRVLKSRNLGIAAGLTFISGIGLFMIAIGICLFALFSWKMSQMNLESNAASIITVPLTTLAVSSLKPVDIPQGAALNNMMRQLGGSFGLALVNIYLHIRNAQHRSDIVCDSYLIIGLIFIILPTLLLAAKRKGKKLQVVLTDH